MNKILLISILLLCILIIIISIYKKINLNTQKELEDIKFNLKKKKFEILTNTENK